MERHIFNAGYITGGVLVSAGGLECFLLPNHFIDGGVTGVSMLLSQLIGVSLPVLLVLVNTPFLLFGYRHVGLEFSIKSIIAIIALAVVLALVPFPVATSDHLLASVFGGFFVGAGVGLAMRGGGVLDGTEILAVVLSKRTFATVGEIIMALNIVIFAIAAIFLGVEPALYSMLTYFTATKTIDYLLHGFEAYNGVMIVSKQHEAIRQSILAQMGRGVTAFKAQGGYTEVEQYVLYCVVTRLELTKLESIVRARDASAFVVISPIHEVNGGVVKRRAFH
jgi:uncharacterized membrane-anchored protein YitT (DUF2179 family)